MPFVKIDTGILNSTLWVDKPGRDVFLTALLMAEPIELLDETPALNARDLNPSGFVIPAGWYGIVRAAGVGIVRQSLVPHEDGMTALERLGDTDFESRSKRFEGRRLVRVDGGFIVLNFMEYRDRDYTSATRQQRYRDRRKIAKAAKEGNALQRDVTESHRDITEAVALAEAEAEASTKHTGIPAAEPGAVENPSSDVDNLLARVPESRRFAWASEINVARDGMHGPALTDAQIAEACRDYVGNGHTDDPKLRHFRGFLASVGKPSEPKPAKAFGGANKIGRVEQNTRNIAAWLESQENPHVDPGAING